MSIRKLVLATAILVGAGGAAATAPPSADFGDTVTSDVVLTGNLSGSGNGLVIGAHGITVDLNGYTISSTDGTGLGIDNTGGYDGVTIRNGAIEGFQEGIRSVGGDDLELQALSVSGASGDASVTGVIHVLSCQNVRIEDTTVSVATTFSGPHGIRLDSVAGADVKNVHVDGAFIGVSFMSVDPSDDPTTGDVKNCTIEDCFIGILVANSDDASIKGNVVRDANGAGVGVGNSQGIRIGLSSISVSNVDVKDNEIHDVGIGILGTATGFPIMDLSIKGNHAYDSNRGLLFVQMQDSEVKDNDTHDNELFGIAFNDCDDNVVCGNTANANGLRGLVLVFGSDDNLICDNEANDNQLEGISLLLAANAGNTIKGNTALGNGVWDLFHNAESTPNTWQDNEYDYASGADID